MPTYVHIHIVSKIGTGTYRYRALGVHKVFSRPRFILGFYENDQKLEIGMSIIESENHFSARLQLIENAEKRTQLFIMRCNFVKFIIQTLKLMKS